jgi:zinc transport system substrate-binding protein
MPLSSGAKKIFFGVVLATALVVAGVIVYVSRPAVPAVPTSSVPSTLPIVVTFYPLADFAKRVGGDLVTVTNITPAGAEPHEYEPTPRDIAAVYSAKLFIMNGLGVDAWADKISSDVSAQGVTILRMNERVDVLSADPHVWLDPMNAMKEVDAIAEALIALDPIHADQYRANRDQAKAELVDLDREYTQGLATCEQREIMTTHNAFGYLAHRYHFTTRYILGLSPEEDPSPQTIARMVDISKAQRIRYIFFETLVSPKLAQTVATEIGAETLVLNPIEGLTDAEIRDGKNYMSVMRENLIHLRRALVCQ